MGSLCSAVLDLVVVCVCLIYWLLLGLSKPLARGVPNTVKQSVLVQNFLQQAQERLASLVPNRVTQSYSLHFKHRPHSVQGLSSKVSVQTKVVRFYKIVSGNDLNCHVTFLRSLSVNLQEVFSVDQSDVLIVFVPIVSRAGTDVEAALKTIPADHPVVFVVLHHTFNPDNIVPKTRIVGRNIWPLDCLFHEDQGLLKCHHNTKALEETAKYLQDIKMAGKL